MSVWNLFPSPTAPAYSSGTSHPGNDIFAPGPTTEKTGVPYADLAAALNAFMTQQAKQPFIANLPDYENLVAQRSKNTGAQLRGEVPTDVTNLLMQHGAEGGAGRGFAPGSPNTNSAWLAALGLTSIGQQEMGSKNLTQSIADTPVPQLFNPASLFVPERLGLMGLGAAQAGQRSEPQFNYGGGAAPSAPRFGGAAGVTGMPWGPGGPPDSRVPNPARGPMTEEDLFNRDFTNEGAPFPSNYSPFGTTPPDYGGNYDHAGEYDYYG